MEPFEGVVPQRANPAERLFTIVLPPLEIGQQIQHPADMVAIDVADHDHPQIEPAVAPDLIEPRPKHALVDTPRAAVDQNPNRPGPGPLVMHQKAIAFVRLQGFKSQFHQVASR